MISRRMAINIAIVNSVGYMASGCSGIFGSSKSDSDKNQRSSNGEKPLIFNPSTGLMKVNETRAKFGLPPFTSDPNLQNAAQTHADLMARTGNYGHEIGPGTKFPQRLEAAGFDGSAGENLGVGYGSIEDAIEGWLDSPKHRKILLRRNFDRAGIAYSFNQSGRNPRYTHFWVLLAGRKVNSANGQMLVPG
ncbi:MAG: CAP domain-containing protein [Rhizobiaceae bacterium]